MRNSAHLSFTQNSGQCLHLQSPDTPIPSIPIRLHPLTSLPIFTIPPRHHPTLPPHQGPCQFPHSTLPPTQCPANLYFPPRHPHILMGSSAVFPKTKNPRWRKCPPPRTAILWSITFKSMHYTSKPVPRCAPKIAT